VAHGLAQDVAGCLAANMGQGNQFAASGQFVGVSHSVSSKWAKGGGGPAGDEVQNLLVAHSLKADGFDASEDGTGRGTPVVAVQGNMINCGSGGPEGPGWNDDGAGFTMTKAAVHGVAYGLAVRRLTPRECERLQGFPDGWTDVPYRDLNHTPDGPRYKAIGNSKAVNAIRWIGRRIQMVDAIDRSV